MFVNASHYLLIAEEYTFFHRHLSLLLPSEKNDIFKTIYIKLDISKEKYFLVFSS